MGTEISSSNWKDSGLKYYAVYFVLFQIFVLLVFNLYSAHDLLALPNQPQESGGGLVGPPSNPSFPQSNLPQSGPQGGPHAGPQATGVQDGMVPIIPGPEVCNDGLDNEGDRFTDFLDTDCKAVPARQTEPLQPALQATPIDQLTEVRRDGAEITDAPTDAPAATNSKLAVVWESVDNPASESHSCDPTIATCIPPDCDPSITSCPKVPPSGGQDPHKKWIEIESWSSASESQSCGPEYATCLPDDPEPPCDPTISSCPVLESSSSEREPVTEITPEEDTGGVVQCQPGFVVNPDTGVCELIPVDQTLPEAQEYIEVQEKDIVAHGQEQPTDGDSNGDNGGNGDNGDNVGNGNDDDGGDGDDGDNDDN
jgi:hypothetical protein